MAGKKVFCEFPMWSWCRHFINRILRNTDLEGKNYRVYLGNIKQMIALSRKNCGRKGRVKTKHRVPQIPDEDTAIYLRKNLNKKWNSLCKDTWLCVYHANHGTSLLTLMCFHYTHTHTHIHTRIHTHTPLPVYLGWKVHSDRNLTIGKRENYVESQTFPKVLLLITHPKDITREGWVCPPLEKPLWNVLPALAPPS